MYAIIVTGGKQYRVKEGQTLAVERLPGDVGEQVALDQVLLVSKDGQVMIGQPFVKDAAIKADIVAHGRGKKIDVIKFKRRKNYHRKQGHRQSFTEIKITSIQA